MDKNKESAFPSKENGVNDNAGMTLRDYFAAKAIPSVIRDYCENGTSDFLSHPADMEIVAEVSYRIADAMLKYRNNEQGKDSSTD